MTSVALAVTDGAALLDVAAPFDVFGTRRPELPDPWYELTVCAAGPVRFGRWFRTEDTEGLDRLARAHTVIVPGLPDVGPDPPRELVAAVAAAHRAGARVASVCTGAFVLAAAGLLDGLPATTHWLHAERLARRYPRIRVDPNVLYVDNGSVLTSAGKAAGMDLCLHIVRADHGAAVANTLARRLVVPPHRPGGQAQFIAAPVPADGERGLAELLGWTVGHLHQPLTVDALARRAGMSTRNLARHFIAETGTTPLRWLLAQRVHRARELLETTDEVVDLIADRTGMGTATTLRRHFTRTVGVPPDTYRRTFRAARTRPAG